MQINFDANKKLHTFLSKKQYLNIQGVPHQNLIQLIGSDEQIFGNIPEQILHRSHKSDQIITFMKDTKPHASCECFTLILHIYMSPFGYTMYCGKTMNTLLPVMEGEIENYKNSTINKLCLKNKRVLFA